MSTATRLPTPTFEHQFPGGPTTEGRLRVGDGERTAVAERLADHYADGRLDRLEFDDRLERALSAKTRADLDGLLAGLPGAVPGPVPAIPDRTGSGVTASRPGGPLRRRGARRSPPVVVLVLIVLIAAAAGQEILRAAPLWPVIVLAAILWVRHHRRPESRRRR